VTAFSATVHQNVYLPRGASAVHAIVNVAAEAHDVDAGPGAAEVIVLDCSGSMGSPWLKMEAARVATGKAIDRLRDGTWFAIVAGTSFARLVYPDRGMVDGEPVLGLAYASPATRAAAKEAVGRLTAGGGTAISHWLAMARGLFETRPGAINHCLLLTDGQDEGEERAALTGELERCLGRFECDCRGFGTDWDRAELRQISDALLGSTDIIPDASRMDAEFESIVRKTMSKQVGSVFIQVMTPLGTTVKFFRQVSPEVMDLTDKVTWQQQVGLHNDWQTVLSVDTRRPLVSTYPTGAWGGGEDREYHVCLEVTPQQVGEDHEVRAGRVAVVVDGQSVARAPVRACWTDDTERTTRIDRAVAHYTGQEELAVSIEEGLEARQAGDRHTATRKLGRAAQLAVAAGNEQTTRLLLRVVDIEDAERGTVRLKSDVSKEDLMTLDTRSRKTVRLNSSPPP
jgi:Mg-chelatase subunit ChlD